MAEVATLASTSAPIAPSSPSRKRSASPSDERSPSTALVTTQEAGESSLATQEPPTKKTKLIRRKRRPARPQVDASTLKSEPPPQTGTVFNIWYNKWAGGDREDAYLSKTKAINRCSIKNDSGWTQADKVSGSYFCLFFARGICPKGHECPYLHRLPGLYDIYNPNIDCFGRDKHSDYRDDMGGVGSFLRQNRTLYVGRINVTDDIEEVVARHFQEWGEIDRIRVLTGRGVAFITYVNEANSQFAKEAMAHQSLDHDEILNVRWATVDPNPLSQKREAARIEEQAAEAVRRALGEKAVKQIEGRESREEIAARKAEATFGLDGYEAPDSIWFNRQNNQLLSSSSSSQQLQIEPSDAELLASDDQQQQQLQVVAETTSYRDSDSGGAGGGGGGAANSILGSSALSALRVYSTNGRTLSTNNIPAKATNAGPLVGYGSDDDSD